MVRMFDIHFIVLNDFASRQVHYGSGWSVVHEVQLAILTRNSDEVLMQLLEYSRLRLVILLVDE